MEKRNTESSSLQKPYQANNKNNRFFHQRIKMNASGRKESKGNR